jgi:hypothetical protein
MISSWFQQEIAGSKQNKAHAEKAGDDAFRAIIVKIPNTEFFFDQSSHNDGGHEIAGDHEEYVDPNKSTRNKIDFIMK